MIDKPIQHRLQFRLRLNLARLAMLVSPPPATTSRGSVEGGDRVNRPGESRDSGHAGATESRQHNV